jgi:hypothetical protein
MNDLNGLFSLLAEENKKKKQFEDRIKEAARKDFDEIFDQLSPQYKPKEIVEEVLIEAQPISTPIGEVPVAQQIVPTNNYPGTDQWLKTPHVSSTTSEVDISVVNKKIKFLEQWIGKIQNAGPGSGEVNLRYLDDVARETISDGRWLKYDGARKKFVFDEINPYEVVYNTTEVTTPTYTVQNDDYYIGVNYDGPVTITLPSSANSGRMLIIKDEDGDAEINPITVLGAVDNDTGGFIIQINNGGVQLLYRNGWRIV